eukprot:scaffold3195_cov95-Pinguiococcus_pyrenoidosus.AAC.1
MGTWQTIRAVDTLFVSRSKAVNQVLGCRVVMWHVWEIVGPQRGKNWIAMLPKTHCERCRPEAFDPR